MNRIDLEIEMMSKPGKFIGKSALYLCSWALVLCLLTACALPEDEEGQTGEPGLMEESPAATEEEPVTTIGDKWSLWTNGTQLRGANTWQRIVVPELDGPEFLGDGYIGPPYTQADFDNLAELGANYVNLSHPGLFTERPPYVLDEQVQANLDGLIEMAAQADLFVVITFRTGPGRSDFTFYRDGAGDWFDAGLLVEHVWTDPQAQEAWARMWRHTAERYRGHPAVAGYDLMCEPNSNDVVLGLYEPEEFYPRHAGGLPDWNLFYPRLVESIREVDRDTPILVGSLNWGGLRWLPHLEPLDDPRIVYTAHQYEPQAEYTHQDPPAVNTYPGEFDLDWDGEADSFDRAWLEDHLAVLGDFQQEHRVPLAVNEFGVQRWVPNAADFMRDEMDIFERLGINYALWVWDPSWAPWTDSVNGMNFRFGPDPGSTSAVGNELEAVILEYWSRNTLRPSALADSP